MNETARSKGFSKQQANDAGAEEKAQEAPQGKAAASGSGSKASSGRSTAKSGSSGASASAETTSRQGASKESAEPSGSGQPAASLTEPESGTAVDVPLGVLVGAAEKVGGLVEPFTDRSAAEKRVREYRRQLEDSVRKASARGAGARSQAQDGIRRLQEADRLKVLTDRAENLQRELTRALDDRSTRAQELIGQVGEQIGPRR